MLTEQRPSLAPGCFGVPLSYCPDIPECRSCEFRAQCAPIADASLARFRAELGIEHVGPVRRRRPKEASEPGAVTPEASPAALTQTVPPSIANVLDRLGQKGVKIVEALQAGRNPVTQPSFLRVAIDRLLAGGFTRDTLQVALATELNCNSASAYSYASKAITILRAMGAVDEQGDRIVRKVRG